MDFFGKQFDLSKLIEEAARSAQFPAPLAETIGSLGAGALTGGALGAAAMPKDAGTGALLGGLGGMFTSGLAQQKASMQPGMNAAKSGAQQAITPNFQSGVGQGLLPSMAAAGGQITPSFESGPQPAAQTPMQQTISQAITPKMGGGGNNVGTIMGLLKLAQTMSGGQQQPPAQPAPMPNRSAPNLSMLNALESKRRYF